MDSTQFIVRRDHLTEHDLVTTPRGPLAPGDAELRVDRFGFTANNISFALRGDSHAYWKVFPGPRPGWGQIPVWGFGTVVRSASDGVAVGERFYGYFPMASHVVVQPARVDAFGFLDGAAHRRELPGVYNHYVRTTRDPSYRPDSEPQHALLWSLYGVSFFLADYLREYGFFDAEVVVVSSASSKLGYGMAYSLAADAKAARRKIIGVTAEHHVPFASRLGLYDRVISYAEIATLSAARRAVFVDIAGSAAIRAELHRHLGSALRHSLIAGNTHQDPGGGTAGLPGPEPVTFFAPVWIKHRNAQWTVDGVRRRLADAWRGFLAPLLDPDRGWMAIASGSGPAAVAQTYGEVLAGRAAPERGHVLAL
jgi:hypothetical protein